MKKEEFTPEEIELMMANPKPFTEKEIEYRFSISHNRDVVFEKHLARIKGKETKPYYPAMFLAVVVYLMVGILLFFLLVGCSVSRESMTGKEYVKYQQSQANYDLDKWARQYKKLNGL